MITCGVTELLSLQLLGLVLARLPVRRVLPALCILMAAIIPLAPVLQSGKFSSYYLINQFHKFHL